MIRLLASRRRAAVLVVVGACARAGVEEPSPAPLEGSSTTTEEARLPIVAEPPPEPVVLPLRALLAGLLPLRSIGADVFRASFPTHDGRGVVIGILDSGIDAGVPGLQRTSTGARKLLDLRDFSQEGRIELSPLDPGDADDISVGEHQVSGWRRISAFAAPPYYGGSFRELPLGEVPAADANGNGRNTDEFAVIVGKGIDGWLVLTDTDGDGSLGDERPVRDYAVAHETFSYRTLGAVSDAGPLTIAANIAEDAGHPLLDFYFDNSGHGTHVAGIAAGHEMFGVEGFSGVAPGAQLLGLKISNNARGGISVTGSMVRAMRYAAEFAERSGLPLVLNMSFGVGNEVEGSAVIDSVVNEFALAHPHILFVISAGNDGPGLSAVGFPGSAEWALTACALFPGVFAQAPDLPSLDDALGWWSARGGETAKPDLCAPGVAYSNVPRWHTGEEISGGTSMAAPQLSGAAALLQSALVQSGRKARAADLKRALRATASRLPGAGLVDQGAGVPDLTAALHWLLASHQTGLYRVEALPDGGNTSHASAAYRRNGLRTASDTVQRFRVTSLGGQSAARLVLRSDAAWLRAPPELELRGNPATVVVTYDGGQLKEPGLYEGTIWASPATDTLGGPAFGLSNLVAVPHRIDERFTANGVLQEGRLARYFLEMPAHAGGLTVSLQVRSRAEQATLYLFEPNGAPYRGGNSAGAGGDSTRASIEVSAEDLRPGVYEAVVVAPPTQRARYQLTAEAPRVSIRSISGRTTAMLQNQSDRPLSAQVSAEIVGATHRRTVTGPDAAPLVAPVDVPPWASRMVIDVQLPTQSWGELTDFGVTVFDESGQQVSQGPLNYAFGRQVIELDSAVAGRRLDVELFPAFALKPPPTGWTADLTITFLASQGTVLPTELPDSATSLRIGPGTGALVRFGAPSEPPDIDPRFSPLIRVVAETDGGGRSIRHGSP